MNNFGDILFKTTVGLFFSSLYLGTSFLASYLCAYWNICNPSYIWIAIGLILYISLMIYVDDSILVIGGGLMGVMNLYYRFTDTVPSSPFVYLVINSIICIAIILACIKRY